MRGKVAAVAGPFKRHFSEIGGRRFSTNNEKLFIDSNIDVVGHYLRLTQPYFRVYGHVGYHLPLTGPTDCTVST